MLYERGTNSLPEILTPGLRAIDMKDTSFQKGRICLANIWYGAAGDIVTCITLTGICRSLTRDRSVYVSRTCGRPPFVSMRGLASLLCVLNDPIGDTRFEVSLECIFRCRDVDRSHT